MPTNAIIEKQEGESLFSIQENGQELARVYALDAETALKLVLSKPQIYGEDMKSKDLKAVEVLRH